MNFEKPTLYYQKACFRFWHVAKGGHGKGLYIMTASIWIATAIVTTPVIYFTDIVEFGPDRSTMCILAWTSRTRVECEVIISKFDNITCEVSTQSCGGHAPLVAEKAYGIAVITLFILTPIFVTISAYYGIIHLTNGQV